MPRETRATARAHQDRSESLADMEPPSTPIQSRQSQASTPATPTTNETQTSTRKSNRAKKPSRKLQDSAGEFDVQTPTSAQSRTNVSNLKLSIPPQSTSPQSVSSIITSVEPSDNATSATTTISNESFIPLSSVAVEYGAFSILEKVDEESRFDLRLKEHRRLVELKPQTPLLLSDSKVLLLENREWNIYQRGDRRMGPKRVMNWPSLEVAKQTRIIWIEFGLPGHAFEGFLKYFIQWEAARFDAIENRRQSGREDSCTTSSDDQSTRDQLQVESCSTPPLQKGPRLRLALNNPKEIKGKTHRRRISMGLDGTMDMDSEENIESSNDELPLREQSQSPAPTPTHRRLTVKWKPPVGTNQVSELYKAAAVTLPSIPRLTLKLKKKPSVELHRSSEPKQQAISPITPSNLPYQALHIAQTSTLGLGNNYSETRPAVPADVLTPAISQFDESEVSIDRLSLEADSIRAPEDASIATALNTLPPAPPDAMQIDDSDEQRFSGAMQVDEFMHEAPLASSIPSVSDLQGQLSPPHSSPTAVPPAAPDLMQLDIMDYQTPNTPPHTSASPDEENFAYDYPPPDPILATTFLHHLTEIPARGFDNLDCLVLELDYFPNEFNENFLGPLSRWLEWFREGVAERCVEMPVERVVIAGVPMREEENAQNEKTDDGGTERETTDGGSSEA